MLQYCNPRPYLPLIWYQNEGFGFDERKINSFLMDPSELCTTASTTKPAGSITNSPLFACKKKELPRILCPHIDALCVTVGVQEVCDLVAVSVSLSCAQGAVWESVCVCFIGLSVYFFLLLICWLCSSRIYQSVSRILESRAGGIWVVSEACSPWQLLCL